MKKHLAWEPIALLLSVAFLLVNATWAPRGHTTCAIGGLVLIGVLVLLEFERRAA